MSTQFHSPDASSRRTCLIAVVTFLFLIGWLSTASAAPAGAAIAWGYRFSDDTTIPGAAQSGVVAVAAGSGHILALKIDGSVVAWGDNSNGQMNVPLAAQSGVMAIAAGGWHAVALRTNGEVIAWGYNSNDQTTVPVAAKTGVVAISAGAVHTVALKNDGSVIAWGAGITNTGVYPDYGQSLVPADAQSGIVAVAAGGWHTVALKNDGSVIAWGAGATDTVTYLNYRQSLVPASAQSGVQAIAAGFTHTAALKVGGGMVAWGKNDAGQTAVPATAQSGVLAIAAGGSHTVILKTNGNIVAWGDNGWGQATVPATAQRGATAIAAGYLHTVALVTPVAPVITVPPASRTVNAGQVANFAVVAPGYPLSYQWRKDETNLIGATNATYCMTNVQASHAGSYIVVVSNILGSVTSAPSAILTVNVAAPAGTIYFRYGQSPSPAGHDVQLCSSISAAPPATFQWQRDDVNLLGANYECLGINNVSSNQAGVYRLVASNAYGIFTSAPVTLAVDYYPPSGFLNSSGLLPPILAGGAISITSQIKSAPPPTYQWQFNGVDLPGYTYPELYLSNLQTNQGGSYRLIARNPLGSFTSAVAVVSVVYAAPSARVELQPYGHTPTMVGGTLRFCSSVSGAPYPTLQWQFNGTNLPTQTNACLELWNLQTNQSGGYAIVASNYLGAVTSAVAVIEVVEPVPVLAYFDSAVPPLALGIFQRLCAQVSQPTTTFQWRFNGTNLAGATRTCLDLDPLQPSHAGEYSVVATTTTGIYTSAPISLTVHYAPPRQAFPSHRDLAFVGEDVGFQAYYSGSPGFIQWRFNGAELPGQTNASLSLLAITTNQAGQYSFTATNQGGATTSSVVTLSVYYSPPVFINQPFSQSLVEGNTARFTSYARGGPPPEYFLEQNGTNVAVPFTYQGCCGQGVGGFSLLDTTLSDAGRYRVVASNAFGTAASAAVSLAVMPAGPLDRWSQRNPLPQSQPLLAVAHSTNQFVAVGERGTILTSTDGSNWALQNRRGDVALNGVAYGGGLWVAVGDGGTILSSSDGTNWSYRFTASATALNAVTYSTGRFVAVGSAPGLSTLIMHSTNGVNWARIPINSFSAEQCVTYGNGLFIAAGSSSILTSPDGTNWGLAVIVGRQIESLIYANGQFVAVGDDGLVLVSTDGASWQPRPPQTTRRLLGVTYGAGRFVAAGGRGALMASIDASNWTSVSSGTPDRVESIDFWGGTFVAVGENGTIITSTNGTSWTKQNFGVTRDLDGMHVANGLLVVVGKGGNILTSTDGLNFTSQNAGVTNDLHGVTWGGGLWVAVGEPGIVLTSTNAVHWIGHTTSTTNSLKDATYAGGQWIVVGTEGTILRSTDGANWSSTLTEPAYDLNDVAYGNGMFLVAGDGLGNRNGSLFTSADGVLWSHADFYPGKNLRGVTFANDVFLIAANDGIVFITTNGLDFGFSYSYGGNLRAATWAQGLWIVVGNDGTIVTSPDTTHWTRRASRTFENQHQVALLDGKLVVIGNRGGILQSGRFVTELKPPEFTAGSGFRLPFRGVANQMYQVQVSTNLLHWSQLLTLTNLSEHGEFLDPNPLQVPQQFYRLVEP